MTPDAISRQRVVTIRVGGVEVARGRIQCFGDATSDALKGPFRVT